MYTIQDATEAMFYVNEYEYLPTEAEMAERISDCFTYDIAEDAADWEYFLSEAAKYGLTYKHTDSPADDYTMAIHRIDFITQYAERLYKDAVELYYEYGDPRNVKDWYYIYNEE